MRAMQAVMPITKNTPLSVQTPLIFPYSACSLALLPELYTIYLSPTLFPVPDSGAKFPQSDQYADNFT